MSQIGILNLLTTVIIYGIVSEVRMNFIYLHAQTFSIGLYFFYFYY
jgi:hypothetical protein